MKTCRIIISLLILFTSLTLISNESIFKPAKVDFDAYEKLVSEVKAHRKSRLIDFNEFQKSSKEENVVILDTRTAYMYNQKHIKGAIHLNFSDFTQDNLTSIIPSFDTKILIYCNNNFDGDPIYFATKKAPPVKNKTKELTLALNIPTYINLYGYGYRNVYELSELVSIVDKRLEMEGRAIVKTSNFKSPFE